MASIVGKKINGGTYYYLVDSARVDGAPRIVGQRYLGTAADIAAAVSGARGVPARTEHRAFGAVAAVWAIMTRLGVAALADELLGPARRSPTPGARLALAVVHRIVGPTGDGPWWTTTAADRFLRPRPDPAALDPRAFWAAMDRLPADHLDRLADAVLARAAEPFGVAGDALALDLPAFGTLSDTAPAHRQDTRPVLLGLRLIASRDGVIPLLARPYLRTGLAEADAETAIRTLAEQHRRADLNRELTLVLEPGQHDRIPELIGDGQHVVAALPLSDFPTLAKESASVRVVDDDRFPGVRVRDTRCRFAAVDLRVLVVRSATLHAAQSLAFADALTTATRQLSELARALTRGTVRRSRDRIMAEVAGITRNRRVDRVLSATVTGGDGEPPRLHWRIDEAASRALHTEVFGCQLIATSRDTWGVDEILTAYRARHYLDSTLRQLDDPAVAPWPGFEWTEHRLAVHALVGVLATTVTHVMRHEAHRSGLDFSVRELLDGLAGVEETVLRYPSTGGRPRTAHRLTDPTAEQQRLIDLFDLRRYAPHS